MKIDIPGFRPLDLSYLILDYNGTVAIDGIMPDTVKQRLQVLAEDLQIYILTADTHGTAKENCQGLPLTIQTFPTENAMMEKLKIVGDLGAGHCVAVGNGRNDVEMLKACALSIAVMDKEGMYGRLLAEADVCVHCMEDALDLLCSPKRLTATLRG